jgi:galactoside O-acetyltransferase
MNYLARICNTFRVYRYKILSGGYKGLVGKLSLNQPLLINGNGLVSIGEHVSIGVETSPGFWSGYSFFDLRGADAFIKLGNNVKLNNNASLIADEAGITVGDNTVIGVNLLVQTSDGHSLDPAHRNDGVQIHKPVIIGDNVFIGDKVTILKGVRIGENSTIGACSVVTGDIPENVVAAGNPCRVLRSL